MRRRRPAPRRPVARGRVSRRRVSQRQMSTARRGRSAHVQRTTFLSFPTPAVGEEEIAAVTAVSRSDRITTGSQVAGFEAELAAAVGAPAALALGSCTAGLPTANLVEHAGARPVFADVESDTPDIDPAAEPSASPIARVLARLTAALVAGSERDAPRASCAGVPRLVARSRDAAAVVVARRPPTVTTASHHPRRSPMPLRPARPARRLAVGACALAVLAVVGSLLVTTPAAAAAQAAPTGAASGLRPGDQVRIAVWRNPELSGDFVIGDDGSIQHPIYRSIVATGVSLDSIEMRIGTLLRRFENDPQFVVQPLVRVAVGGQVRSPSLYLLSPSTTVGEAVVLSGGVGDEGRLDNVRLIRQGRERRLDLTRADLRDALERVESGDQIMVQRGRSFLTDVLLPASSLVAAAGSIALLIINNR